MKPFAACMVLTGLLSVASAEEYKPTLENIRKATTRPKPPYEYGVTYFKGGYYIRVDTLAEAKAIANFAAHLDRGVCVPALDSFVLTKKPEDPAGAEAWELKKSELTKACADAGAYSRSALRYLTEMEAKMKEMDAKAKK